MVLGDVEGTVANYWCETGSCGLQEVSEPPMRGCNWWSATVTLTSTQKARREFLRGLPRAIAGLEEKLPDGV